MQKEELEGDKIFVVREFLDPEECAAFIALSEGRGYESAPITTAGGFVVDTESRDNSRVVWDDPELAERLFLRAEPCLPPRLFNARPVGMNERFRFYRYERGQQFAPHYDGVHVRDGRERSESTFMIYLNADFDGGFTKFYQANGAPWTKVRPERGMALVFQHKLLHEGAAVHAGRKYVLRTDVMFRKGA